MGRFCGSIEGSIVGAMLDNHYVLMGLLLLTISIDGVLGRL